ncbi:MAG: amino acid ABC transporter permease [Armatimonadota bacterium]|nr:amino acid ABC transporter permease [Armatimonadota bacterium]
MLEVIRDALPFLMAGAITTINVSVAAMGVGLVLGLVAALCRMSRARVVQWGAVGYIELIRGTPLLAQLFLLYYGLPQFGIRLDPFTAAVLGLGINYGAYLAEVYRAGILSIDRGQWEAGFSIGMSWWVLMYVIILPQAIRVILPPVGNYFISMLKDSALAATIAVSELLRQAQLRVAVTFRSFEIYALAALIYFIMSYPLSLAVSALERRATRDTGA